MFIAVILVSSPSSKSVKETINGTFNGDSLREVAAQAEASASLLRQAYTTNRYRVVAGQMTHEVEPPELQVSLRPLTDPPADK